MFMPLLSYDVYVTAVIALSLFVVTEIISSASHTLRLTAY